VPTGSPVLFFSTDKNYSKLLSAFRGHFDLLLCFFLFFFEERKKVLSSSDILIFICCSFACVSWKITQHFFHFWNFFSFVNLSA
jgi:hypothetical protein